jgi:hypothetical protein
MVTPDVWLMFKWVRRAIDHGIMPEAGGGMDQTDSFLEAWDFMARECQYWEAKLKLNK